MLYGSWWMNYAGGSYAETCGGWVVGGECWTPWLDAMPRVARMMCD